MRAAETSALALPVYLEFRMLFWVSSSGPPSPAEWRPTPFLAKNSLLSELSHTHPHARITHSQTHACAHSYRRKRAQTQRHASAQAHKRATHTKVRAQMTQTADSSACRRRTSALSHTRALDTETPARTNVQSGLEANKEAKQETRDETSEGTSEATIKRTCS